MVKFKIFSGNFVGVVIAGRINKLIERKDEDENPEEKEENN